MSQPRILIVDDNRALAENLAEIFDDIGYATVVATSAKDAATIVDNEAISLVITDLVMPEASGVAVVQHVRLHHPGIPVLVMTAFAGDQMREQAESAGALEVIDKPIDMESLVTLVARLGGATGDVLVVDDDLAMRLNLAEVLLEQTSLVPHHVGSIAAARALLASRHFAAVITDYRLPDGDGIDFAVEAMKASSTGALIFVTGFIRDARPRLDDLLDDHRVSVLEKPFDPMALLALLERTLPGE